MTMKKSISKKPQQNTEDNLDLTGPSWVDRDFKHPERVIHIGTCFSGVGAIEYAFKRLGLKTKIEFAGDIDKNCKKAYFANYDITDSRWHTDIHEFSASKYNIIMVISG